LHKGADFVGSEGAGCDEHLIERAFEKRDVRLRGVGAVRAARRPQIERDVELDAAQRDVRLPPFLICKRGAVSWNP
jgi:hypothetical protein